MAFENLSEKLHATFKKLSSKGKLSESDINQAMREVKLSLLEADVNYKVAKDFINTVTEKCLGEKIMQSLTPSQMVVKIVKEELTNLMGTSTQKLNFPKKLPIVIMMCGLQGSGKTTHSAKLGKYLKEKKHRPLLVACDIYRPAAIEQLKIIGEKASLPVFEMGNSNPVDIAKSALKHALDYGNDVVILDTAGRLHIDEKLMSELKDIQSAIEVHETLLVIDSMTGQDAVNVSKSFNNALDISGVILTKLDGDTRGGAALSVLAVTGKHIKFIGTGEKISDLQPFHPDRMASRILGMGDILTLIENVEDQMDQEKALELSKKMQKNQMDLNDLQDQLKQVQKMGSIKSILSKFPGMGNKLKDVNLDEKIIDRSIAIISSMSKEEKANPGIINPSRKRRIAAGSGLKVEDVNKLLKQFRDMQKMYKQFTGRGKKSRRYLRQNFPGIG